MEASNFKRSLKSPLSRQLILMLLLLCGMAVVVVTALNAFGTYQQGIANIESQLEEIVTTEIVAVTELTWATNEKDTQLELNSIVGRSHIDYVAIVDESGVWLDAGEKSDKVYKKLEEPLVYRELGKQYEIGKLVVIAGSSTLQNQLIDAVLKSLVSNIVVMGFIVLALFMLIDILITRHVVAIADYVNSLVPGQLQDDLVLDKTLKNQNNEIVLLAKEINKLKDSSYEFQSKLLDSEDRYKAIADYTYDWESWHHPDGSLHWVNHAVERITGYTEEECLGMADYPLPMIHASDKDKARKIFGPMALQRTSGNDIYLRIVRKNGSKGDIAISWQPIFNNRDEYLGIRSSVRDVTERREAEKRLQESETRFRTLIENIPGATFRHRHDEHLTLLYISNQISQITGYTPFELIENQTRSYASIIFPEDRGLIKQVVNRSILRNLPYTIEYRLKHKNGDTVFVFVKGQYVTTENESYLEGVIIDVTEQKLAAKSLSLQEKEQELILDTMIDAVISINIDGKILSVNHAAADIFGYSENELLEMTVEALMTEDNAEYHTSYIKNYVSTGKSRVMGVGREIKGVKKDGTVFPLRISIAELPKNEDEEVRYIGVCHDITMEKLQEEQIRRTQKMDALGKLTGGIAHDFNNTLGVILGYSQLLDTTLKTDSQEYQYVEEILKAGERAKSLTSKLLTFSRKKESSKKVIDINEIVQGEKGVLEKTLTVKIKLFLQLTNNLYPVRVDESFLVDAILNMSINSMHAMPDVGVLTISTENKTLDDKSAAVIDVAPGDYAVLTLKDNGIGIPDKVINKVFDPFFTTKGDAGTGLGLSQVYGFVRDSNGGIKLDSSPERGTTISLYFPKDVGVENSQGKQERVIETKSHSQSYSILVVDDEKSLTELARVILEKNNYSVQTSNSGSDAVDLLKNQKFDLLISDVLMPGMNGYELATSALTIQPDIKIQMVSGYTDNKELEQEREYDHLHKPFGNSDLLQAVQSQLS